MIKKWIPVVLAVLVFAGLGWSAPTILNNMIRPHAQDESTFPANNFGQPAILYGTDAGVLYLSPGDAGAWVAIGSGGSGGGSGSGCSGTGPCFIGQGGYYTDAGIRITSVVGTGTTILVGDGLRTQVGSVTVEALPQDVTQDALIKGATDGQLWCTSSLAACVLSYANTQSVTVNGSSVKITGGLLDIRTRASWQGISSGSNAIELTNNGSRIDFGTGANDYCSSNGTNVSCPALTVTGQQQVLATSYMDGLPWTSQNARAAFSVPQAFTPQSFAFLGAEGTKTGTPPNIRWGITNPDGGECSGSFPCDQVCPDAGGVCSVPMTGQCSFSSSDIIFGTFLGGNGCVTNPASGAPIVVWGSLN